MFSIGVTCPQLTVSPEAGWGRAMGFKLHTFPCLSCLHAITIDFYKTMFILNKYLTDFLTDIFYHVIVCLNLIAEYFSMEDIPKMTGLGRFGLGTPSSLCCSVYLLCCRNWHHLPWNELEVHCCLRKSGRPRTHLMGSSGHTGERGRSDDLTYKTKIPNNINKSLHWLKKCLPA